MTVAYLNCSIGQVSRWVIGAHEKEPEWFYVVYDTPGHWRLTLSESIWIVPGTAA
jgi:hypothetical protein